MSLPNISGPRVALEQGVLPLSRLDETTFPLLPHSPSELKGFSLSPFTYPAQLLANVDPKTLFTGLIIVTVAYLLIVRHLRFRSVRKLEKKYGTTHKKFQNIDYKDAQNILGNLFLLEAPWLFLKAKDFAFLRAFGISSISETSVKAKKMIDETGLRYSDTLVFATEWILNPLDSERATLSLNRVNFIHSRYKAIKDEEMVYTLCLLVCEIFEWIDKYEWRQSVPLERYASYVFWKEVGIRMGIAESIIPKNFDECAQFIKDFEIAEMHPSYHNERIAHGVIKLYESTLPKFLRPLFTNILISFMEPRLRSAVMLKLDTTSLIVGTITNKILPVILDLRKAFVRHCMLPRTTIPTVFAPSGKGDGRSHVVYWQMLPHYAPVTLLGNWGPYALYCRLFGLDLPGKQWMSEGYKLEEVGYGGRGSEKVLEVMEKAKNGGCPYSTYGRVADEQQLGGIYAKYGSCPMAKDTGN